MTPPGTTATATRQRRDELVRYALDFLSDHPDPTVTGATLILPDGETVYISVETARAARTVLPGEVAQ